VTVDNPVGPEVPVAREPERHRSSTVRTAVEWVVIIAVAVGFGLFIKAFVLGMYWIPTASMEPTLNVDDRIVVNKLSYRFHDVNRGDIVVFERPPGETASDIHDLIKRVVGLEGERIEAQNGQVLIDGHPLAEPYLPEDVTTSDFTAIEIPEGQVFVMGDNRGDSRDSRFFGPIDEDSIEGRAFLRVWPLGDLSWL
jgi:signal peptidase I